MNKIISYLTHEPKQNNPWIKYGFLVVLLALLIVTVIYSSTETRRADYLSHPIYVPLMLILNHLASEFAFTKNIRVILRSMAVMWILFLVIGLLIRRPHA